MNTDHTRALMQPSQIANTGIPSGTYTIWPDYHEPTNSYGLWWSPYVYALPEPTTCIGKAHVFECDHVETCQCGKVTRVMPKQNRKRS